MATCTRVANGSACPRAGTPPAGFRQNTDPWVFGDSFFYSNCKQLTPRCNPSALQRLSRGSLVLFGSATGGRFVIDTVVVVAERVCRFTPASDSPRLPAAFRECTFDSLRTLDDRYSKATFILYRGATPQNPVDGMFSFVPCMRAGDDGPRFERPSIRLAGMVNADSKQSPSGGGIETSRRSRRGVEVNRRSSRRPGLALGVGLREPDKRSRVSAVPAGGPARAARGSPLSQRR